MLSCCLFSYFLGPEPLVIELFTFIPRRLGKHQNLHVVCAQADLEGFVLWDQKFSWGCLKQRNMSAEHMVVPCVLNVSETGSSALSLLKSRRSLWKYWKHKHRVRKLNKNEPFLSNKMPHSVNFCCGLLVYRFGFCGYWRFPTHTLIFSWSLFMKIIGGQWLLEFFDGTARWH